MTRLQSSPPKLERNGHRLSLESEVRMPKRQPCFRARTGTKCSTFLNNLWNTLGYFVQNFTNSSISISHHPQPHSSSRPTGPLPIGCQCSIRRAQRSLWKANTSEVDIKFVHIGSTDAPGPSSRTNNWCHDGVEEFFSAQKNRFVGKEGTI